MNIEEDELPPSINFFSRRAQLVATVSPEEIRTATELLNKEKSKLPLDEEIVILPVIKPTEKPTRGKKLKKNLLLGNLVKDDVENKTVRQKVTLSPAAKRRVEKRERERDLELKGIEEENEKVLSSLKSVEEFNDDIVDEFPANAFEHVIVLTISYLSELSRLKCYDTDKFSTIFPKVAELFNLKASEILLSHNRQIIDVNDTPQSLGIAVTEVLECIPYVSDQSTEAGDQYDTNNLKILFQSNDSKEKVQLVVHKLEKMQTIMEKYSQQRDISLDYLTFEFDGEKITGSETPDDLDMESGNTIDVRVSVPEKEDSKKTAPKKATPKKRTPKKRTPKKRTPRKRTAKKGPAKKRTPQKRGRKAQKDIVTVNSDSDDSEVLLSD